MYQNPQYGYQPYPTNGFYPPPTAPVPYTYPSPVQSQPASPNGQFWSAPPANAPGAYPAAYPPPQVAYPTTGPPAVYQGADPQEQQDFMAWKHRHIQANGKERPPAQGLLNDVHQVLDTTAHGVHTMADTVSTGISDFLVNAISLRPRNN